MPPIVLDGTAGITTPGLTNTGTETLVNLTTTGNTTLGDATTDTLTVGVTGIVKDASGNVGIGTASPSTYGKLVSLGADNATLFAAVGATNMLRVQGYNSTYVGTVLEAVNLAQSANTPLFINGSTIKFGISGTTQTTIDSSGNVGIGTSSPNATLHLGAGGASFRIGITASNQYGELYRDGATGNIVLNAAQASFGNLVFQTTSTERMRIDSSGNLLVGTTSVFTGTYAVNVMGAAGNRSYLGLKRETASTTGVCGSIQSFNGANTIGAIDFAANGANNSGLIQTYTWSAGSAVQGPYVNTGGTSWTTASDETLKDIIAPIEEATSKLSGLRTVFGKYKTDHDDVRRIFLIAQDVQAVLPEAVSTDGNGKLGLNYQDLVPVLVKAIQEQQALIQSLTNRISALESK